MKASKKAEDLIKRFESCRLTAYKCPAGIWTIGWGTTGLGVKEGLTITQKTADSMLKAHIEDISLDLTDIFGKTLEQNEFDAIVSFVYNIGLGAFKKSTMCHLLLEKKMAQAALEFDRWVFIRGERSRGLTKRREAEKELFLG